MMLSARSIALALIVLATCASGCFVDPADYSLGPQGLADGGAAEPGASGLDAGGSPSGPGKVDGEGEPGSTPKVDTGGPADTSPPPEPSAGGMCIDAEEGHCQCNGTNCACTGDCKIACDTNCRLGCPAEVHCKYETLGDGAEVTCESGSKCDPVRCAGDCEVHCATEAKCNVQCDETLGSSCLLFCSGDVSDCKIERCGIGGETEPTDCGGGVFACNRACP